jgi:hypothetical protein
MTAALAAIAPRLRKLILMLSSSLENLIDQRGYWTSSNVRESVRHYGCEDVVITWVLRGWNLFEKGPLK